ncbi:MAG TPA: adenine deaminase [Thermoleophilaceae bacterium]|nr:adenine deaminase [Thermoleophilaceae bacterium]
MSGREQLLAVARGDEPADLVIRGARVFSVFTREWLDGDVAVACGRFAGLGRYEGSETLDAGASMLVPGFVDAHVHIESSLLTLERFAELILAQGTTTIVADPHELANVVGADGVHWLLDAAADVPLNVFVMAPSCVPASRFESPRGPLGLDEIQGILARDGALGVAEMMDFPALIAGDPEALAKVEARGASHVDGHAPGVSGHALNAYLAAGIVSDHEATTYEEALEKRRKGAWILIREASNARNLEDLLPLVRRYGPERCAFCTDDREADVLLAEGHINGMCRTAVRAGLALEEALVLATHNGAACHGLAGVGAVAPGYRADFSLLSDTAGFRPERVYKDGRLVALDGEPLPIAAAPLPDWLTDTVQVGPLSASDFAIPASGAPMRVIELVPGQLLTTAAAEPPRIVDGMALADPARDLAKIAVVERHRASGRIGRGLVRGFGLREGAFASTVSHDAHNIVVVGVSDVDMEACVRRLVELRGGIVVARAGAMLAELALPVAGLMSDQPGADVARSLGELRAAARTLGVELRAPFMALSFLGLSVIPALKITDRGLVDVERFELVPLELGT